MTARSLAVATSGISFEDGVAEVPENFEYWRNAPLWDVRSVTKDTRTWFKYLSAKDTGTKPC